jgi:hypothetical protein
VTRRELTEFFVAGCVAAMVLLDISRLDSSVYNNYVRLAVAFLQGHVWIDWPGPYIDAIGYGGRHYVIEGPVPAILMMPFAAFFGLWTNQTAIACGTAAIATAAAWLVARRLGAGIAISCATTAFFLFGTSLAWCAMYGAVWYVAHTVAVMFAMLAVAELLGKRRLWLVALLIVLAAGSRFTMVLALAPLVAYLIATLPRARRAPAVAALAGVLVPALALYVAYNDARWGGPADIGYALWYHSDPLGAATGSPFQLYYFTYEVQTFFATFPTYVGHAPWLVPAYGAVSIEVTSIALVLALFPSWRGRVPLLGTLWAATLLVAGPSFLYYVNGGAQWGMRHALDFEPFLLPLVVMGAQRLPPWVTYALCGISVLVGIWGLWYWRTFYDSYLVHKAYGM